MTDDRAGLSWWKSVRQMKTQAGRQARRWLAILGRRQHGNDTQGTWKTKCILKYIIYIQYIYKYDMIENKIFIKAVTGNLIL